MEAMLFETSSVGSAGSRTSAGSNPSASSPSHMPPSPGREALLAQKTFVEDVNEHTIKLPSLPPSILPSTPSAAEFYQQALEEKKYERRVERLVRALQLQDAVVQKRLHFHSEESVKREIADIFRQVHGKREEEKEEGKEDT